MTAPLVYIAAPLGAPTPTLRRWHRERANLLACLAFAMGFIPVWVHEVAERALGDDTDPGAREKGMRLALAAVERVRDGEGHLWALLLDNGDYSAGCRTAVAQWANATGDKLNRLPMIRLRLWSQWRYLATEYAPHLVLSWDRLATPPTEPAAVDGVTP